MIPDIGLMIAAYTVTRLVAMLSQPINMVAKVFSGVAIAIIVISMIDLLSHGTLPPS